MRSHHTTTSTLAFMHVLSIINIHHQLHFTLIINVISKIMSHGLEEKTQIGKADTTLTPKKKPSAMATLFV